MSFTDLMLSTGVSLFGSVALTVGVLLLVCIVLLMFVRVPFFMTVLLVTPAIFAVSESGALGFPWLKGAFIMVLGVVLGAAMITLFVRN